MQRFSKFQYIIIGLIIGLIVVAMIYWVIPKGPKFSKDPRIRERQKEAVELQFFEKVSFLRFNPKELFGWDWWSESGIENNVTFKGSHGSYEIEYEALRIFWDDYSYLKINYNGTRVYEAGIKSPWGVQRVSSIKAYIPGDWIDVFNEMITQARKGIPEELNALVENWGITN